METIGSLKQQRRLQRLGWASALGKASSNAGEVGVEDELVSGCVFKFG